MSAREHEVLEAVERRRRLKPKLRDELVTLAHGAGGKATHALVEALFLEELGNPLLDPLEDAARVDGLAFTTDSFVVKPLFFPGGDIGDLAVNGTVNDLAVSGARPRFLTLGLILEEGFAISDLERVVQSIAAAARAADVTVVAGDTKVVERGKADGLYVSTAGLGVVEHDLELDPSRIRPGDRVLVSGTLGDHGMAIMVARGGLDLEVDLDSDTAPLGDLAAALVGAAGEGLRCMRDPTRGGLATVLNELAAGAEVGIVIDEGAVPV